MEGVLRARTLRIVLLVALGLGLLLLGYVLRTVLLPVLVALLLGYYLDPLVTRIERARWFPWGRRTAVGMIFSLFFISVGLLFLWGIVEGVRALPGESEITAAGEQIPVRVEKVLAQLRAALPEEVLQPLQERVPILREGRLDTEEVGTWVKRNYREIVAVLEAGFSYITSTVSGLAGLISFLILVPVYTFFFLTGMGSIRQNFVRYLPGMAREKILKILKEIDRSVSAFFRGKILILLLKGLLTALGLWMAGVPLALPIGLLSGLAGLVPFAGFVLGIAASLLGVGLEYGHLSLGRTAVILGVFGSVEVIEGAVLVPAILGKETGLHPVTVVISFFVFGELFGFFGVLLAVPLASTVKILATELVLPHLAAVAAESPARARDDGSEY